MKDVPSFPDWQEIKNLLEECRVTEEVQSDLVKPLEEKEQVSFVEGAGRRSYEDILPVINSLIEVVKNLGDEIVLDRECLRELQTKVQSLEVRISKLDKHMMLTYEHEMNQEKEGDDMEGEKLKDSPLKELYHSVIQLRRQIQKLRDK